MNDFEADVRATYEALLGRQLADAEVAEIALSLRQFAAFLIECGRDDALRAKLGLPPSAGRRVADNTTQNARKALGTRLSSETAPPTASSRDALPHRDSSALAASTLPAGRPVGSLVNQSTTGANVNGSQ